MSREPPTIEHNPNEKRQPWWLWWVAWAFFAIGWAGILLTETVVWHHVVFAAGTGALITAWAFDIGGMETPASWRRKPPRQR
jgi:hypothetical protein